MEAPKRNILNWKNKDFNDLENLDKETRRVFDICHGCRRCFNLCDSFPKLFDIIDESDEKIRGLCRRILLGRNFILRKIYRGKYNSVLNRLSVDFKTQKNNIENMKTMYRYNLCPNTY